MKLNRQSGGEEVEAGGSDGGLFAPQGTEAAAAPAAAGAQALAQAQAVPGALPSRDKGKERAADAGAAAMDVDQGNGHTGGSFGIPGGGKMALVPPPAAAPAAAAPTAAAAAPAAAAKKKSSLDSYRMRGDPVTAQEFIANAGLLAIGARGELAPGTSVVFFLEGYLSGALADSRLRLSEHLTSEQDEPLQAYELCTVEHAAFAREKGTASVAGLSSLFALKRHGEASGVFAVDNVPDSDCPNYLVLAEDFTRGMSAGWAAGDRVEMYFPQEERPLTHGEWYGGTIKAVDAGRMAVNGWDAVTIEFDQNPGHPQQVNPWELRRVGGAARGGGRRGSAAHLPNHERGRGRLHAGAFGWTREPQLPTNVWWPCVVHSSPTAARSRYVVSLLGSDARGHSLETHEVIPLDCGSLRELIETGLRASKRFPSALAMLIALQPPEVATRAFAAALSQV